VCITKTDSDLGAFEYLLMLAVVVLALAVSDIAISLNRLLDAGARVRWDALAPLAALVAFLKIVTQWWSWYQARPLAKGLTFEMYVAELVGALLLFLLAAAALPSAIEGNTIDLRTYYGDVRRRYWWLFISHWVVATGVATWIQMQVAGVPFSPLQPGYLVLLVAISLTVIASRWWHALCLIGFSVLYLAQSFGRGIAQ
jgi:putative Mn2+ efflux pump MntP